MSRVTHARLCLMSMWKCDQNFSYTFSLPSLSRSISTFSCSLVLYNARKRSTLCVSLALGWKEFSLHTIFPTHTRAMRNVGKSAIRKCAVDTSEIDLKRRRKDRKIADFFLYCKFSIIESYCEKLMTHSIDNAHTEISSQSTPPTRRFVTCAFTDL